MTTARQIVTRALRELMYMQEGESPSAQSITDGLDALNGLLASFHNQGMLIFYPPGKTWIGDWSQATDYAIDDAVSRNGSTYYCTLAHTSSVDDQPGSSANWATYWTLYAETPMTLSSTFPLDVSQERGVIALLAVELAPMFGVEPSPLTFAKSKDGMNALYGQFFRVPEVAADSGLTRMTSVTY
jgi:hypothetical protein